FLPDAMVPANALEMIALAMGLVGGILCVVATSNAGQQSSSFWKKTRYQGYSWLLISGFSTLALNWKSLDIFKSMDQAHFAWLYAAWAFSGIVAAHVLAIGVILVEAGLLTRSSMVRNACLSLVVRFIKDGWEPYQTERKALQAEEFQAARQEQEG